MRRRWNLFSVVLLCLALLPAGWVGVFEDEVADTDYAGLLAFAGRVNRQQLSSALAAIDPLGQLAPFVELGPEQVVVRRDLGAAPLVLKYGPRLETKLRRPRRVLLDPGHRGGAWSQLERRHVMVGNDVVREGNLTYATSLLVKEQLEAAGIEVQLSRTAPPSQSFEAPAEYDPAREARYWLAETRYQQGLAPWLVDWGPPWVQLWLSQGRDAFAVHDAFELYNRHDLRQRASFTADVTLSLHYNMSPSQDDGVIVFVAGGFLPGELETAGQRYHAIRHALGGRLAESTALGRVLGQALQRELELPVLDPHDDSSPELLPRRLPLDVDAGVYARNLAILRRVPGVVLLLEGPVMNHPLEHLWLRQNDGSIEGNAYSARVQAYARAVSQVLLELPD